MRHIDDVGDDDDDDVNEDHYLEVLEDRVTLMMMMLVEFVEMMQSVVLFPMNVDFLPYH